MYIKRILAPGDDLADAFSVRMTVFVDEQGFDPALELDDTDSTAHHVVLYDEARPVATGRLFPSAERPGAYVIGRVAVLGECRGGTGRQLMEALEAVAAELGAAEIELGAQCRVQGFYGKLGYTSFGEVYMDEHCPHIHMRKTL